MKTIILLAIFLANCFKESCCYTPRFHILPCKTLIVSSPKAFRTSVSFRDMITRLNSELSNPGGEILDEPYLQHVCPSCSYVYDESKGFKKRHPPGDKIQIHSEFILMK